MLVTLITGSDVVMIDLSNILRGADAGGRVERRGNETERICRPLHYREFPLRR